MENKNLRVLFLLTSSDFGGTETSVMRLALGMKERGIEICICSIKELGHTAKELSKKGITVRTLNLPSTISIKYPILLLFSLKKWKDILNQEMPNILHSFLFQANFLCAVTPLIQGNKKRTIQAFIHSLRTIEGTMAKWRIILERWVLKRADVITTVSGAVRQFYIKRERIDPKKFQVIYHGINDSFFKRQINRGDLKNLREELGIMPKETLIGTVARLHPDKGIEILLEGLALTINSCSKKIKLIIIGNGPDEKKLKNLAELIGIKESVIFTGFKADICMWVSLIDIFCLTSKKEGFPQSLIEAMALGKPVIATDVGGVNEIIKNNFTGLLIPANDPNALCKAIIHLLDNPKEAREMGLAGKDIVMRRFRLTKTIDELIGLYNRYI